MACDAEDCGFQMLNDDEIVASVQEEFEHVNDETDKDQNNNECGSVLCVRDSHGMVPTTIRVLSYSTTASQENQIPCSEKKVYNGRAKNK
ncbi:uncharacterized protein TNCV_3950581 [Trichonephila clavipes]|nr:uncharacterized protein TNCV_3950581 [Trichonephila clavipes]